MDKGQKYSNKEYLNIGVFLIYFLAFTLGWYHSTRMMIMVNLITFVVLTGINYKTIKSFFEIKYILLWGLIGLQLYRIIINQIVLGISFRQEEKEIFWVLAIVNTAIVLVSVRTEMFLKKIRDFGMFLNFFSVFEVIFHRNPLNVLLHRDMDSGSMFTLPQIRCQSIFNNPIIYAVFIVVVWSVFLCYPYKSVKKNVVMTVITLVTILGTGSRSSWIPFFVITIYFCLQNYMRFKGVWLTVERRKRNVLVGLGIASFVVFGWLLVNKYMYILERMSFEHIFNGTAATIRKGNIVNIIHAYMTEGSMGSRVFGTGMGGAATVVHNNPILGWDSVPDNQYLTFLYDYGILSLLCLMVIGGVVLLCSWKERENAFSKVALYMGIELAISLFFWEGLENGSVLIYTAAAVVLCCKENIRFQKAICKQN